MGAVGGMISGTGQGIADIFGSNAPPKAVLNQYAKGNVLATTDLTSGAVKDTAGQAKAAYDQYMAGQGKQGALAGQQEGILNSILQRRQGADPNQLLQSVGNTAFGFINPNVINPLAQFDVNSQNLQRRAAGLNPAAVDSTANRLRDARVASGRYYDVAKDVYNQLPNLYGQAYGQGVQNDQTAAGIVPQISQAYEGVANRPFDAISKRLGAVSGGANVGMQGINAATAGTQGYQQQKNFADRLGAAGQHFGDTMAADEDKMMSQAAGSM